MESERRERRERMERGWRETRAKMEIKLGRGEHGWRGNGGI